MAFESPTQAASALAQTAGIGGGRDGSEPNANIIELLTRLIAGGFLISDGGVITLGQPPVFSAASLTSIPAPTSVNADNLTSGTVPDARFPATLPAASGANLTALNASNLASGTVPDARFPATLPAASGANLTALNASNLGSGTVPDARFPATLPAASGVNLTALNATNIASGTLAGARLPAGTIKQVVTATYSTGTTSSSSTFADTGLTASITLADNDNKVLVIVMQAGCEKDTGNTSLQLKLVRDSTDLITFVKEGARTNTTALNDVGTCGCVYLDTPASASALTYKTQFASKANIAQVAVQNDSATSTIALLEVVV